MLLKAGSKIEEAKLKQPTKHLDELYQILGFHRRLRVFMRLKKLRETEEWPSELKSIKTHEFNKLGRLYI